MQLQPNNDSTFTASAIVAFDIGQQVFAVDSNNAINVLNVFSLVVRFFENKDVPVVVYGCKVNPTANVRDYPTDSLYGTMQAAVDYVVAQQARVF